MFRSILIEWNLSEFRIQDQKIPRRFLDWSLSQIDESDWEDEEELKSITKNWNEWDREEGKDVIEWRE